MTRVIATLLVAVLAVVVLPRPKAYAGDKEWATAGKILAGVVGVAIVPKIATSDRHNRQGRVYRQNRRWSQPHRRVRYVRSPRRYWVDGYYETREVRVRVDGYWEKVWVEPEYRRVRTTQCHCSGRCRTTHWERMLVREGYFDKVWREGYWEVREVREWVAGHWEYR